MTATRIHIDWTRCDGHGLCAALLPDRIQLDEWGFPVVRHPDVVDPGDPELRETAAACPALAFHLEKAP